MFDEVIVYQICHALPVRIALLMSAGDPRYRAYGSIVIDGDDADLDEFSQSQPDVAELAAAEHEIASEESDGQPMGSFTELHTRLKKIASSKTELAKFVAAFMAD